MFSLCESMKWAHLPVSGGLYDQNPDLIDGFRYIFSERAAYQEMERQKEERKKNRPSSTGVAGRRHR